MVIGCSSVQEVRPNLAVARDFAAMTAGELRALEQRIAPRAARYDNFKA